MRSRETPPPPLRASLPCLLHRPLPSPSHGLTCAGYIPEEVRSTIMNVFRMGLNLIVVVALVNVRSTIMNVLRTPPTTRAPARPPACLQIDSLSQDVVFLFTVLLLTLAIVCQHRLFGLSEQNVPVESEEGGKGREALPHAPSKAHAHLASPPRVSAAAADRASVADGEDLSSAADAAKTDASA